MPANIVLPLSHCARLPRLATGTIKGSVLPFCPAFPWQPKTINYFCGHLPWNSAGVLPIETPVETLSGQPLVPVEGMENCPGLQ